MLAGWAEFRFSLADAKILQGPYQQLAFYKGEIGRQGVESAKTRLRIRLYIVLKNFTNLTIDNAINHTAKLLTHFGIEKDDEGVNERVNERVRQTVMGRSKKEKESMVAAQAKLIEWMSLKTGDNLD